jgi:hypothetical protein
MSATIAELNIVKNRCAASSMLRRIWLAEKWVSRLTRKKMGVPFCVAPIPICASFCAGIGALR